MFLGKVRIRNFKSIKDTKDIYIHKGDLITILAGQNESGKTAFLKALKFFEEGIYASFEEEDRRIEDSNQSPRIDCTFMLSQNEYETIKEKSNKKIADYIKKNGFCFVRGSIDEDDVEQIKYVMPKELKEMIESFESKQSEAENEEENNGNDKFSVVKYLFKIRPKFVFYSSFFDNLLPRRIMYNEIPNNQAVKDFEKVYDVNFQELLSSNTSDQVRENIKNRINAEASESLNKYRKQTISGEKVNYTYSISMKWDSTQPYSYVNFFIRQGNEGALAISQKSQGFQWFSGFNLRLRAHQKEIDENGVILLIDEPGQGLHERAQEDVKNVLEELAGESKIQIIYSTHLPILLGKENIDFDRLLLVEKTKKLGTIIRPIQKYISENGNKDALSPIKSALGLVSIPEINNNKKYLIVEGITEYYYFKAIFGSTKYVIIPSTGADQIPNIYSILFGWGINAKIVLDAGKQGEKVGKLIKNTFFLGEDSQEFKRNVFMLDDNGIETVLSTKLIDKILKEFGLKYNNKLDKVSNVEQKGCSKLIFAKKFYDMYIKAPNILDKETKTNFDKIQKFLDS